MKYKKISYLKVFSQLEDILIIKLWFRAIRGYPRNLIESLNCISQLQVVGTSNKPLDLLKNDIQYVYIIVSLSGI